MRHPIRHAVFAIAWVLGGAFVVVPMSPPASALTVPPTVNATTWTSVHTPNAAPGMVNFLNDTNCVSSTFCVAVGGIEGSNVSVPIERWNGSDWSLMPSPVLSGDNPELNRVSCVTSSFCVGVGEFVAAGGGLIAEQWNGQAWSVTTPTTPPGAGAFYGVSCVSVTVTV